ncbi:hypothetical protein [Micromonospora musae]
MSAAIVAGSLTVARLQRLGGTRTAVAAGYLILTGVDVAWSWWRFCQD